MKQRRTSLKDLADQLGVSIATVSRALRNSHEVGEEMTQKVKSLAKELNYRPNPFAQSLRKEAPRVIGVIVPNLVTHYYAAVLDGIEDYAVRNGYSVISANSHENTEHEKRAVENFLNMHNPDLPFFLSPSLRLLLVRLLSDRPQSIHWYLI